MKSCSYCRMSRSRLHRCVMCGLELCGCCSFTKRKGKHEGKRVCCYPGDKGCQRAADEELAVSAETPAA